MSGQAAVLALAEVWEEVARTLEAAVQGKPREVRRFPEGQASQLRICIKQLREAIDIDKEE